MYNATVVKKINVTDELIILSIKPDGGVPEFKSGQYVALGLMGSSPRPDGYPQEREAQNPDKLIKRAYSIGSSPSDRETLEFYIAIVKDGALSSRMMLLKDGDRLFAAPKITGTFTLESVPAHENLILLSTGTGLAPFISMIRTESTWTNGRKITVVHGVRYPQDLGYRDELEALSRNQIDLKYIPVVSRGGNEWTGCKGHIQGLFDSGELSANASTDHVFLCGNPAMITDMEGRLSELGYQEHNKKNPSGKLHVEKYW